MWKRPDDKPGTQPGSAATQQTIATPPAVPQITRESRPPEMAKHTESFKTDVAAHIGKSVVIKGELSGSEDLYLDGEVEGMIDLHSHSLIIGPNARIRANVSARELVVHGRVEGNVTGAERVELKKSCVLTGDISTQRIVIEDGAFFKGAIDLQKEAKAEVRGRAAAAAAGMSAQSSNGMAEVGATQQHSFLDHK